MPKAKPKRALSKEAWVRRVADHLTFTDHGDYYTLTHLAADLDAAVKRSGLESFLVRKMKKAPAE